MHGIRDPEGTDADAGTEPRRGLDVVLGIDASTPPSSLAVVARPGVACEVTGPFGRETDGWIIAAIDAVLERAGRRLADIEAVVTTVGPGTFTGVRVGIATCLGLSAGIGMKALGVDTLLALAASATLPVEPGDRSAARGETDGLPVLACVDARRGEVYASWFDSPPRSLCSEPRWGPDLLVPEALARRVADAPRPLAIGSGIAVAANLAELVDAVEPALTVAGAAARLALATGVETVRGMPLPRPQYLRRPDARRGRNPLVPTAHGEPPAL